MPSSARSANAGYPRQLLAFVSSIRMLDLYARGGRDLKQADYLLDNVIEKRWKAA